MPVEEEEMEVKHLEKSWGWALPLFLFAISAYFFSSPAAFEG
jgi:hypothetical protein